MKPINMTVVIPTPASSSSAVRVKATAKTAHTYLQHVCVYVEAY